MFLVLLESSSIEILTKNLGIIQVDENLSSNGAS